MKPAAMRLAMPLVLMSFFLSAPTGKPALAQNAPDSAARAPSPIDPGAMAALNKMGVYLRTLTSFQVWADVTTDNVLDDGQAIQFSSKVDLVAARPNRMRIEVTDDDGHRFFFFDGKNFTIFGQVANFYATVPAPPTLALLADSLNNKYGIELPLMDLFKWAKTKQKSTK
jgi:hypothetical protein